MMTIPLVIWSCKKNSKLLKLLLSDWIKFAENNGLEVIVVTDSKDRLPVKVINFTTRSWQSEWLQAINILKSMGYTKIISILDDFLLRRACERKYFKEIFNYVLSNNIDYLALEPSRNYFNFLCLIRNKKSNFVSYIGTEVYPSSLRPSIWSLDLLERSISSVSSIWQLEHTYFAEYNYATITSEKFSIKVSHILEKGRVNLNAFHLGVGRMHELSLHYGFDKKSLLRLPRTFIVHQIIKIFGYYFHKKFNRIKK